MNAEALFRFEGAVRGIDFCEGMVGLCREGIFRLPNYFKRRNRKIERKWGENKNRFLNSKDELFESKNRFFESKDELFESKNRLFESKVNLGENKNELFESKNKLFESNGVWVKIRIAFSQMRQILGNLLKGNVNPRYSSGLINCYLISFYDCGTHIEAKGEEEIIKNPYAFASSGMANADPSYDQKTGRPIKQNYSPNSFYG